MHVLQESAAGLQLDSLEQAWASSWSLALLPKRVAAEEHWLSDSLNHAKSRYPDRHFFMLTSGSTGQPKLVIGSKLRAEALAEVLHAQQLNEPVIDAIGTLPLTYTFSFVNQWVWARVKGRRYVPTRGLSDTKSLADALKGSAASMACLVGVQAPLIVQLLGGSCFPSVVRLHFAGGRFPQERIERLRTIFPSAVVFNNYGCAEAMPRLTLRTAEASDDSANVGQPLPGVSMRSNDGGAIEFQSPFGAVAVIEGGECREIGPSDWLPSGDLGAEQPDGSWRLSGRASEVFKRHGEKVSLTALSGTVAREWRGQQAFYRETDPTGEEGCVLALAPPTTDAELRSVLLALRHHHPRAHWPLRIETLQSLPETSSGKPDAQAIKVHPDKVVVWQQRISGNP